MKMQFDEAKNAYVLIEDKPVTTAVATMEQSAHMEASGISGALSSVANFKAFDLPIGGIALGTVGVVVLDRVIGSHIKPDQRMLADLAAAFAVKKFGSKFIGDQAATWTAGLLVYEAIADLVEAQVNRVWKPTVAAKQDFQQGFEQDFRQNISTRGTGTGAATLGRYGGSF